jgi:hypothetical protein
MDERALRMVAKSSSQRSVLEDSISGDEARSIYGPKGISKGAGGSEVTYAPVQ